MLPRSVTSLTQCAIIQVGWTIFEPVEAAAARWSKLFGIGPFFSAPHVVIDDAMRHGRPTTFDHTATVAQWGDVQLELMLQHCDSPSHLTDISPDGQPRLASLSWIAADYEAEVRRLADMDFPVVFTCSFAGTRVAWCDTRAVLGCHVEVFEDSAMIRRALQQCRKASDSWDGARLVRPMEELLAIEV